MQTQEKITQSVTKNITIASGQAAAVLEFDQDLDTKFDVVDGIEAYENSGSAENYQIAIRDSNGEEHFNFTNKNFYLTSKDVAQKDKTRKTNIPIRSGRKVKVLVKILATTSADINLDVVLHQSFAGQY